MSSTAIQPQSSHPSEVLGDEFRPPNRARLGLMMFGIGIALMGLLTVGAVPRLQRPAHLAETVSMAQTSAPSVCVVRPRLAPAATDVVLPGNIQAIEEAPIYAPANGFLRRRLVDIGDRVRAGQLLAEIETPELDQQFMQARTALQQARATLTQTRSSMEFASTTAERWNELERRELVAHQEAGQQRSAFAVSQANFKAAQATVNAMARRSRSARDSAARKRSSPMSPMQSSRGPRCKSLVPSHTLRVDVNTQRPVMASLRPRSTGQIPAPEFPHVVGQHTIQFSLTRCHTA